MTEETTAPAGWYDDGSGRQRWFDGQQWGIFADEMPAATPVAEATEGTVIVRRTRRSPFTPPPEERKEASSVTVSRNWVLGLRSASASANSGLTRNRKIAGDLPDWAPLPPGELVVDRSRGLQS